MVRMRKEWPDEGDLVVGTVHKGLCQGKSKNRCQSSSCKS
jgi:hypothetical protein